MRVVLIIHKKELVTEREDEFLFDVDDWYDCNDDEYVKDHSVYRRKYNKVEKDVPYYFNPAINSYIKGSLHLDDVLKDEKVCWLANMVTYYRHTLKSWNKCWGQNGSNYRSGWFGDYDEEKIKVNERQKRKIIRVHLDFIIENEITVEHFKALQHTDEETIKYFENKIGVTTN